MNNEFKVGDEVYVNGNSIKWGSFKIEDENGKLKTVKLFQGTEKVKLLKITPKRYKIETIDVLDPPVSVYVKNIYKNYEDVK